jgi:predicted DCC family thiol-disulfide oxidoreductase YuxK
VSHELPGPVVLVDGECNICDASVRFLIDHDVRGELHYAPLQGETASRLAAAVPGFPAGLSTIALVEPDGNEVRLLVRSAAVLRALELTGGTPRALRVLRLVPRPLLDLLYRGLVRIRYRVFGRKDVCRLPTPKERSLLLP